MDIRGSTPDAAPSRPAVKRMYGRRKQPAADATLVESTVPTDASSRAASTDIPSPESHHDSYPPTSDGPDATISSPASHSDAEPGNENDDDDDARPSRFEFDWRKKLRALDEDDDLVHSIVRNASDQLVDGDDAHASPQSPSSAGHSLRATSAQVEVEMKSSDSGQQRQALRQVSPTASRSPSPVVRRKQRGRSLALMPGSDSESSDALDRSPLQAVLSRLPSPPAMPKPPTAKAKGKQRATEALQSDQEHTDEDGGLGPSTRRRRSTAKSRQKRVKPLTKKELAETRKATARINAERDAALPTEQTKRYEITDLLAKLTKGRIDPVKQEVPARIPDNSDPIQPFSSSPSLFVEDHPRMPSRGRSVSLKPFARTPSPLPAPSFQPTGLLGLNEAHAIGDSSDEEMPDVGSLLHNDAKSREEQEKRQRLAEAKRRAMAQQQSRVTLSDGDDSDLEIVQDDMHTVAREEAQKRRADAAHGARRSIGRQAQLTLAGVRPRKSNVTAVPSLSAAAAPAFLRKEPHDGAEGHLTTQQLNQMLVEKASRQAVLLVQQKEERWKKVGGRVKSKPADDAPGLQNAILDYAQRVAEAQASADADEDSDEEDPDAEDPDYQPANEEQHVSGNEADSDAENQQVSPTQAEAAEESDNDDENDENASPVLRGRKGRPRRPLIAVHSDDEEDEAQSDTLGRVLVADSSFAIPTPQHATQGMLRHRASTSSLEGPIEGGTDKENDATLAYGDDKENAVIASQPSVFSRASSFFSQSQGRPPLRGDDGPIESTPHDGRRAPFQELRTGEDDELSLSLSSDLRGPARRLTFTPEPSAQAEENAPPRIGSGSPSPIRPVVLKSDLADLFESQASKAAQSPIAPKAVQGGGLADFFSQESALDEPAAGVAGAKISQDLALTEDVALQPALDIRQSLLRKADDIFEKEQQLIAEAALQAASPEKKRLFVNEHGFLTQSRPIKTPVRSQLFTPTQAAKITQRPMQDVFSPRSAVRQPLATIDAVMTNNDDDDDFDAHPLLRLKRRKISPEKSVASGSRGASASPTPHKPRTVFDVMRQASMHPHKLPALLGGKTKRSEFIEGEAEESDDDEMRGFGLRKRVEEDEEDDEAQDQTLQELVDDQDMDENTLAEDAVLEKHREQLEQDDQEVEKLHQDAIQGKLRMARRNRGVGFEDDDSDEEDDEVARARRKMRQKRKVQGDSLDDIAKDPATAPFAQAYLEPLVDDDDDDFKQMGQNEDTLVGLQDMDVDETGEDEDQEEEITAAELRQQLAAAAREPELVKVMDPHDVSYVENDGDSDEDTLPVKEFSGPSKGSVSRKDGEWDPAYQHKRGEDNEHDRARLQRWAKGETRVFVTGRNTGSVSVVAGAKKQAGAVTRTAGRTAAHGPKQTHKVTKTPSLLSTVSTSRRAKFQG